MNYSDQNLGKLELNLYLNITIMLGGKQPKYAILRDFAQFHKLLLNTMSFKLDSDLIDKKWLL